MWKFVVPVAAALAVFASSPVNAESLYTSGAPDGTYGGILLLAGQQLSAGFTLASDSLVSGFTFAGYSAGTQTITTVSYSIGTTPFGGAAQAVSLSHGAPLSSILPSYTFQDYQASIAPIALSAGTYYLSLVDATTTGGNAYWDWTANLGSYYYFRSNVVPTINTQSGAHFNFSVLGTATAAAVPEPSSWALVIGGFGIVGGVIRREKARSSVRLA